MAGRTAQSPEASQPHAVLLDLGGVIVDIDPRACFVSWARAADVDVGAIAAQWAVDEAYKAFEVGAIDFDDYLDSLSRRLGISLTRAQWRTGWNELLRDLFDDVVGMLPLVASVLPLYVFSNTNPVHQEAWQSRFASALAPVRKIYTSWEMALRKPNVEAYLAVADDIAVAPADILFVDDNAENVAGGQAAGLDARLVRTPAETLAILRGLTQPKRLLGE
ncbi:MAG: HAD family phosphatase [Gammaproteobacteria bacterium]|nr:HAD family phosphatase [Gammaproteobacteria bacterium]